MKLIRFLCCLIFFLPQLAWSQNLDSLKSVWDDASKHDTIRLDAASKLIRKYLFSDPNKAIHLGEKMLQQAKESRLVKWQGGAFALIGVGYEVKGDFQKAGENYSEWRKILELTKDFEKLAMALNNIGNIYWKQGDLLTALDYYQKSLKLRIKLNDENGTATCYNNIGLIYSNQKEYDKALEYYQKAEVIFEKKKDQSNLISTYGNLGLTLMKLKRHDEAIGYFEKSLKVAEEKKNKPGIAAAYNNIGSILIEKKEFEKAVEYFEKAVQLNTELGNSKSLASTYFNYGNLELTRNNFSKASELCLSGYEFSLKAKVLAEKMNNCECLYKAEKSSGNFLKSLEYYELYSSYRDSMASEDRRKEITRKEVRFEYEKKMTADSLTFFIEKKILSSEVEKQRAFAQLERLISLKKTGQIDSLNRENYIRDLEIKNQDAELRSAEKAKKLQEAEIELQNQTLEQDKIQRLFLIIGLLMVILFSIFMFNRFRITRRQKNVIVRQKKEVEHQKALVEEKNTEILDSIQYAKHLQNAILPPMKLWKENLSDSFILYKPKDIVAGDFYFMERSKGKIIFAAADCTGHGVPGALVSVVCSNALNRSVKEFNLSDPGKILDKVKDLVLETFERSENDVNDGMDISLCVLDTENNNLLWAGANNPLWLYRKNGGETEFIECKPNKQPIGKSFESNEFITHRLQLQEGDSFYLFTDGYSDQFGGEKGKKFNGSRMKELLMKIQSMSMTDQQEKLMQNFNEWKGDIEQIDDVCVIGVRISN